VSTNSYQGTGFVEFTATQAAEHYENHTAGQLLELIRGAVLNAETEWPASLAYIYKYTSGAAVHAIGTLVQGNLHVGSAPPPKFFFVLILHIKIWRAGVP